MEVAAALSTTSKTMQKGHWGHFLFLSLWENNSEAVTHVATVSNCSCKYPQQNVCKLYSSPCLWSIYLFTAWHLYKRIIFLKWFVLHGHWHVFTLMSYTLFGVVQPALHVPKSFSQQGPVIRRALDLTSVLTNTVTQLPFAAVTSQLLVRTSHSEGSQATVFPFRRRYHYVTDSSFT